MSRGEFTKRLHRERFNRIAPGLQRPCPYCGAQINEPCVSRNGIPQWSLGHTHDARLSTANSRLKRMRRRRDELV